MTPLTLEQQELITANVRAIYDAVHRCRSVWQKYLDQDDAIGIAELAACKSITKWDSARGKITTFINVVVVNAMKTVAYRENRRSHLPQVVFTNLEAI